MNANITRIGLDKEQSAELAKKLNELLSNYQVFYQNVGDFTGTLKVKNSSSYI